MNPAPSPEFDGDEIKPYAPPRTDITVSSTRGVDMERFGPAGSGRRFLNYILDQFGQAGTGFVIAFGLGMLEAMGFITGFSDWMNEENTFNSLIFGILVALIYYYLFEVTFGRTPAKWITGTKVVTLTGGKPLALQVLGRTFARIVPFEPFSFLGGNTSGWHDRWSGTLVVDLRNPIPKGLAPSLSRHIRRL